MPTIMYTGVRLRSNPDCGPLPPQDCDLNLPFIESQLIAIPEPGMSARKGLAAHLQHLQYHPRLSSASGALHDLHSAACIGSTSSAQLVLPSSSRQKGLHYSTHGLVTVISHTLSVILQTTTAARIPCCQTG